MIFQWLDELHFLFQLFQVIQLIIEILYFIDEISSSITFLLVQSTIVVLEQKQSIIVLTENFSFFQPVG